MEQMMLNKLFDFTGYTTYDWIVQVIGFIGLAFFVASSLQKKRVWILICQFIALTALFINMIMIQAVAGAIMNAIGIVRTVIYLFRDKHKWARHWVWVHVFSLLFVGACVYGWITHDGWYAILPMIACVLATGGYTFKSPFKIRVMVLIACPLWLAYDLLFLNYASALNDAITTGSALVGVLAIDLPAYIKTRKAEKETISTEENEQK